MSGLRFVTRFIRLLTLTLPLTMPVAYAQTESRDLYVVDQARPVAAAVLSLTDRYPHVMTYEDPKYEYAGDVEDVTNQVRDPSNLGDRGRGRLLVPRGGGLFATYEVSAETGRLVDARSALSNVLAANNLNPTGGRFRIEQNGTALHVVPTEARNESGQWIQQSSVLDVPISVSTGELNGFRLIEAILDSIRRASGANILGMAAERFAPTFQRYTGRVEAENEPARDVLLRALHSISERFTWHLNYDPSGRYYVLAVHVVAEQPLDVPLDPVIRSLGDEPAPFDVPPADD